MTRSSSITNLLHFVTQDMKIDIPLFQNNPKKSIELNLDNMDLVTATAEAKKVLQYVLSTDSFWVCEYGTDNGDTFIANNFFACEPSVEILEYHSKWIDRDWFEYEKDAIACVHTSLPSFSLDAYIHYALRMEYLSNTIFLINPNKGYAVWIYDRRGMDIASKDASLLFDLNKEFGHLVNQV